MKAASFLALIVLVAPCATAFGGHRRRWLPFRHTAISSTPDGYNAGDNAGGGAWKLSNDFPQFLNQCAIQSFMTLVRSMRDPQTIRWLHNFTQPTLPEGRTSVSLTGTTEATKAITSDLAVKNPDGMSYSKLLTFHGLGAMNRTLFPTWESYFAGLLEQPMEVLLIQSSGVQVKDYELEINPASLCTRIISVREQIASEFVHDLGIVSNMGQHTMDSYYDYLDNQRDDDESDMDEASQFTGVGAIDATKPDEVTMSSGAYGSPRRLTPHNLVFLDYSLDEFGDLTPSPLRKGNFDLVTLLATQESIHRILNNQQSEEPGLDHSVFQQFLLQFYMERLDSHFTGIQRYGRADDFLEELLFSSPRVSTSDGFTALLDPVRVAQMILDERRTVALEWQARCREVPNDHIQIKRLQLDRLMESYNRQYI
jgi:hypothetical protein